MTGTPSTPDPDTAARWREAEERCYAIWLDGPADSRPLAVNALCAEYSELDREIRELIDQLARSDRMLAPLENPVERMPAWIGRYEIVSKLGSGGFGTVFRARQREPVHRDVALKLLRPDVNARAIARFSLERQVLAQLQHPALAKVFDAGVAEGGQPYIAMELIDGLPITDYCDRRRTGVDARLRLFLSVCAGVTHAHRRSIIHRDLKPSNVLVVEHGGKSQPVVIDFGLAKAMDIDGAGTALQTIEASFVGTPAYASPEQAAGCVLDTRTDVYALALILFELLSGDLPHGRERVTAARFGDVLRILREEDPRTPSSALFQLGEQLELVSEQRGENSRGLIKRVRGDLDSILMQGLERDVEARYSSVSALANDVERYLGGQPVAPRRLAGDV